ncbi:BTB/POZ domain-containing protein [Acorus calamus]|uniref:BTB/POZ domain-containing protein n=1 Tax=Acorus calamus TaxID=4465 RepID=A0AAV9E9N8_ACOCL|nr:BTB/POZ domain-containing protein [Acorus calamus]
MVDEVSTIKRMRTVLGFLSVEKNRYMYIRLYPEPCRLSKEQPPMARFILRVCNVGGNRRPYISPASSSSTYESMKTYSNSCLEMNLSEQGSHLEYCTLNNRNSSSSIKSLKCANVFELFRAQRPFRFGPMKEQCNL